MRASRMWRTLLASVPSNWEYVSRYFRHVEWQSQLSKKCVWVIIPDRCSIFHASEYHYRRGPESQVRSFFRRVGIHEWTSVRSMEHNMGAPRCKKSAKMLNLHKTILLLIFQSIPFTFVCVSSLIGCGRICWCRRLHRLVSFCDDVLQAVEALVARHTKKTFCRGPGMATNKFFYVSFSFVRSYCPSGDGAYKLPLICWKGTAPIRTSLPKPPSHPELCTGDIDKRIEAGFTCLGHRHFLQKAE